MNPEKSKQAKIKRWIETERRIGFNRFYKIMIGAPLAGSSRIDKFSSWLLGAAGASFALIISKLDTIEKFIVIEQLQKIILITLLPSALFGVLQKVYSFLVSYHIDGTTGVDEKIAELMNEYGAREDLMEERLKHSGLSVDTSLDIEAALKRFSMTMPWWLKIFGRRTIDEYIADELLAYDVAMCRLFRQGFTAGLQLIFLFGFFTWIAVSLW